MTNDTRSSMEFAMEIAELEKENEEIEEELERLGVFELTPQEVNEQFNLPEGYDIDRPQDYKDVRWYKQNYDSKKIDGEWYERYLGELYSDAHEVAMDLYADNYGTEYDYIDLEIVRSL